MFLDVLLSIGVAVDTGAMGFLGLYVTLHPPVRPATKLGHKIAFISMASGGIALVGLQGVRNDATQRQLTDQVNDMKGRLGVLADVVLHPASNQQMSHIETQIESLSER